MAEMMSRPQQGHQVFAWVGSLSDVRGQVIDGLFPGLARAGLDLIARLFVNRAAIANQVLDKQNEVAALEKIAAVQSLTGWSDPQAVEVGSVGAAQVAKDPALVA